MLIQSNLLDESTVFVSTGLGGHDTLLRYFCVYIANEGVTLQPFQWDIVKKETELVVTKAKERLTIRTLREICHVYSSVTYRGQSKRNIQFNYRRV